MDRAKLLRRAVWLEGLTVGWNILEGLIAITAGAMASSVALIGFGIDSFVETASGAVVGWRRWAELTRQVDEEHAEHLEHRAARVAGGLLFALASYILFDAGRRLSWALEKRRGKASSGSF